MKKLSICIPTYNRSVMLLSQLNFLKDEIISFKDSVEIIVADNCSSTEHKDKIVEYHNSNPFFELKLNTTNLGSIGNIYYLLGTAQGEYVWFVSDDDVLLKGILSRVFDILSNHPDLLHVYLNYSAFTKSTDLIDYTPNLLSYTGYYPQGKQCVIDLFKENGTVSMFITSCIYATKPLKDYCAERNKMTLIDPLVFSFKLASGPTYIEPEVFVLERCIAFSWKNEALAIFSWQVQDGLIELAEHSYTENEIKEMIIHFYKSNKANYLRMLLQAPMKYKIEIVTYLGFDQLKLVLPSMMFNIRRVIANLKGSF